MPFIKRTFVSERLIPNVAIEQFINQFVPLKKAGANYTCCCPFHHEKSPSFCVTPSKQMYYCFGCKAHGTVIDFIMKYKNLGFVEAVEEVAQFAGIEIEYEASSGNSKRETDLYKEYYELMDRCAAIYTNVLNSPEGKIGLDYFEQTRGLSKQTISQSRLGFAPANPRFLQEVLCKNPGDEKKLIDLGMLVAGQYGVRAMYRNRVMIPIFDKKGRVISFGGRTMGDDKPKYMNTKETPIYKKRNELFGLYETLQLNNNRPERIVVVEGYMDVISVRQAGCTYAVASLGTATTPEQIQTMFRYTDKVICCYDGDSAGRHAAWHALEIITPILQEGKEVRFAFLPVEHDPDSLVREQGLQGFTNYLDSAMSFPEFLIVHNAQMHNLKDPNELSIFINETITLIKKVQLPSLQSVSLKLLSTQSGIPENQLYDILKATKPSPQERYASNRATNTTEAPQETASQGTSDDSKNVLKTPMRKLMAFIIQQPTVVSITYHEFALDTFLNLCQRLNIQGSEFLAEFLKLVTDNPDITPAKFIELTRDTPSEKVVRSLADASLGIVFENGQELPFEARIEFFSVLLGNVLVHPLRERSKALKILMAKGDISALQEYTAMQKKIFSK